MNYEITAGDFLAGGGGVTEALTRIEGTKVSWVLNHNQMAIRTNMHNHKGVKHYWADMYKQDEHKMDPIDFAWASIECTQHSRANGGRDKKIGSYTLGWELVRYIKHLMPYILGIENVPEFKDWASCDEDGKPIKSKKGEEFTRWKNAICALGYEYTEHICNAADYGIPTRRIRYFAFFTRIELGINIIWPTCTHSKTGKDGLKKWVPCRQFINLAKEGESIFGRKFNQNIKKGKRKPLCNNTLQRIAGGLKKFAPELYFILHYYSQGNTSQSINKPLNTIPTKDRHALVTIEKKQFIQDYCHMDIFNKTDEPLSPILTWQTKQLITLEKKQFLQDYYGRDNTAHSLDGPANAITCENSKHIITSFISKAYSGKQHHASSLFEPLHSITTIDHNQLVSTQFISKQYNSNGKPEANNQSLDEPMGSLTTQEKMQFISTFFDEVNESGEHKPFDFDIKMRFLEPEELSQISTFPKNYFTDPLLKLSVKDQVRLIGNAVPPDWAEIMIKPVIQQLQQILLTQKMVV